MKKKKRIIHKELKLAELIDAKIKLHGKKKVAEAAKRVMWMWEGYESGGNKINVEWNNNE